MTIRMLIVDDEPVICQGLRQTVPWETIGVEVAGEAYDGAEALRFMAERPVDLVLTDIQMDGMDGLELAKALKERQPQTRIIILSGYDDFEYARRALRLGIEDYLLKPVDIDELLAMVRRIAGEMEDDAERRKKLERDQWLKWMIRQFQGGGALEKDGPLPGPSAEGLSCRFVASELEDYAGWAGGTPEEERQAVLHRWESAVHAALRPLGQEIVSFFPQPNLLLSLCIGARQASCPEWSAALAEARSLAAPGPLLHFGVSPAFAELAEARARCAEAVSALQLAVVPDGPTILFHPEDTAKRRGPQPFSAFELEKQLVHVLFNGGYEELDNIIRSIMDQFRENGCLVKDIMQAFKELSIVLQRRLHANGIPVTEHAGLFQTADIDPQLHNSYRAMESLLRRELWSLHATIHSSLASKNHWMTERVKSYIDSRYHTDLKASEVAAWLKITPNYFSNLFKQSFGKGFAEYLNEVRIDHAIASLVETDERVFEIAEKVGYKEYKYFCSIFKSFTGITPTQYRKLAQTGTTPYGKD